MLSTRRSPLLVTGAGVQGCDLSSYKVVKAAAHRLLRSMVRAPRSMLAPYFS